MDCAAVRFSADDSSYHHNRDVVLSTILYVETSGRALISNAGGSGSENCARWASLTYMAG